MRLYEMMFFTRPDLGDDMVDEKIAMIEGIIKDFNGEVKELDKIGRKELAYEVNKRLEGYYVLMQFTTETGALKEMERKMRMDEDIYRYMTLRIDDIVKKIEKSNAKKAEDKEHKEE